MSRINPRGTGSGAGRVLADYQATMRMFLEVQERLTVAYLADAHLAARLLGQPAITRLPRPSNSAAPEQATRPPHFASPAPVQPGTPVWVKEAAAEPDTNWPREGEFDVGEQGSGLVANAGVEGSVMPLPLPLLSGGEPQTWNAKQGFARKSVDLISDPYLDDHRIDGQPVIPLTCAAEYLAEAAALLGGARVRALTDVRMLNGLVLRGSTLDLELVVQPSPDGASAQVELATNEQSRRVAYRASAEFGDPRPPGRSRILAQSIPASPFDMAYARRHWLFQGPRFQTVQEVISMDRERIVAKAIASQPGDFCPHATGSEWIFDPGLLDGIAQLGWIWLIRERGMPYLPVAIGRVTRHVEAPISGEVTVAVQILEGWTGTLLRCNFEVIGADGHLCLSVDDFQGVIDPRLNRLRGQWAGGAPPFGRPSDSNT